MHHTVIDKLAPPLRSRLPRLLCLVGALGIVPFAVVRFMHQEWWAGLLDTGIVAGFLSLAVLVNRPTKQRVVSISIVALSLLAFVSTLYMIGPPQLFWGYPAIVLAFYLLRPEEAVTATIVTLIAMVPFLTIELDAAAIATVTVTMLMTSVFAYAFAALLRGQRQRLLDLATRDPLTNTGNRRALTYKLAEMLAKHQRNGAPAALIIFDLDRFKAVNDDFGHAVGDQILVAVVDLVTTRIRVTDNLYRIGGEEFVLVVESETIDRAARLAEQLRRLVNKTEMAPGCRITISLGVAELQAGETAENWLRRADDALYDAKRAGRNLTRVAQVTDGTGEFQVPAEVA